MWINELMPAFLVLYDAQYKRAYWIYVQEYFASDSASKPKAGAKTLTLRVPVDNEFTEATVDYAQERKAKVLDQIKGKIEHDA
jgi:hypothetical protein